jgi:DNA polymerase-3 subunit delta
MRMTTLLNDLKKGKIAPSYLFFGEEEFLLEEAIEALTQKLIDPSLRPFNLDLAYGDEVDREKLIDSATTLPTLSGRRLFLIRRANRLNLGARKALLDLLQSPPSTTCLVFIAPHTDPRSAFIRDFSQVSIPIQFFPLREGEISPWVIKKAGERGKSITREAAHRLWLLAGEDLMALSNEIEKLSLYVGQRREICEEDVIKLFTGGKPHNIFNLTSALGDRDLGKSWKILDVLLRGGESPGGILAMIARRFTILLKIKLGSTQKLGVHPYYLKEYTHQAQGFEISDLERKLEHILQAEVEIKSGSSEPRLALEFLTYELCRGE